MSCRVKAVAWLLWSVAVLASCDQRPPTDPAQISGPAAVLVDGSSGGNPHFYFLPPLVKKASFSGEFNDQLAPTLEICADTQQQANGQCSRLLARFRRFPVAGDDPQAIEISVKGQHYAVNWQTQRYVIADNTPFRVVVLVGSIQLGYIDLIRTGNQFRNHATNSVINRTTNGGLPLNFRIERGALCARNTECFEGMVGPDGGTFTIERADGTRPAGTEFPAGALDETVTLIIERYLGECLPTDAPQYPGCYRFRTEPHVEQFELPATVGVCLFDETALPYLDDDQLRLWKWSEVTGDPIVELERVTIDYLVCPAYTTIGANSSPSLLLGASRAASILLRPLAQLLVPRPAYAFARNEGGKLINFSRVGWVRPLAVEIKAGDNQTAPAGTQLPDALRIRVVNKYGSVVQSVGGWPVTFTPSGDGVASPPATFTDAGGEATTLWTLATTPVENTLRARALTSRAIAPVPYEADAFFHATGGSKVVWLRSFVTEDDLSGMLRTGLTPTVKVQLLGGDVVHTTTAEQWPDRYYAEWTFQSLIPGATYRVSVAVNGVEQGHVDLRLDGDLLRNLANNVIVANLDFESRVRVKFRILQ